MLKSRKLITREIDNLMDVLDTMDAELSVAESSRTSPERIELLAHDLKSARQFPAEVLHDGSAA